RKGGAASSDRVVTTSAPLKAGEDVVDPRLQVARPATGCLRRGRHLQTSAYNLEFLRLQLLHVHLLLHGRHTPCARVWDDLRPIPVRSLTKAARAAIRSAAVPRRGCPRPAAFPA